MSIRPASAVRAPVGSLRPATTSPVATTVIASVTAMRTLRKLRTLACALSAALLTQLREAAYLARSVLGSPVAGLRFDDLVARIGGDSHSSTARRRGLPDRRRCRASATTAG